MKTMPTQADPLVSSSEFFNLQRENGLLREELRQQWESNHFEHCALKWPHGEGAICKWPLPLLLLGQTP